MRGELVGIWAAPRKGETLHALEEAVLEAGRGIVGDRYHDGAGTFSRPDKVTKSRDVTLIEAEEIERFNAEHAASHEDGAFRRNLVTRGVRLNALVGRTFTVGASTLEGVEWCEPCKYLAERVDRAVLPGLVHRAGLRARVVAGGVVAVGDPVRPPAD